jgi:hypothetical protein
MKLINRVPALRKITTSLSEPVDVDLTTLVNRKSTYQDLKESKSGLFTEITVNYFEMFAFGFMRLAWFIYYTIIITVLAILMTLLMIPMFPNSQKIFVLLYFWLYGMALFSYSIFISSFFSNGKVASIAGSLILFFSSFLILIVQGENGNKGDIFITMGAGEAYKIANQLFGLN